MNKKGFTLIELLAVIIILGVIMTIAIPNVLSMLDKNKKDTFIENAKTMATQAEYTLRKNSDIDYPENGKALIMTLEYLNTDDISDSPYNTSYSPSKSFVVITNKTENEITEYQYYVHLVACTDLACDNIDNDSASKNRGINLILVDSLTGGNRFKEVKQGSDVLVDLGMVDVDGTIRNYEQLKEITGATEFKIFDQLS